MVYCIKSFFEVDEHSKGALSLVHSVVNVISEVCYYINCGMTRSKTMLVWI